MFAERPPVRACGNEAAQAQKRADEAAQRKAKQEEWDQFIADQEAQSRATCAMNSAIAYQDADYHAWDVQLRFRIEGASIDGEPLEEWHDPALWELVEDGAPDCRKLNDLSAAITAAIEPWVSHYRSLGLIRADFAPLATDGDRIAQRTGPRFSLIHRSEDADLSAEALADLAPIKLNLQEGVTLDLRGHAAPINSTMLYDALQRGGHGVGQWGGEATPDLAPSPDESRDDWLARVSLPRDRLVRLVERQRRSGGNIRLFRAAGAASGQVAKERPIEWIVPGLIPRGYVSLLVGTKQAGKSTLLGELLAVVDSECQSPRIVLGTEVFARGVSAF
jgi:hypothetical protein